MQDVNYSLVIRASNLQYKDQFIQIHDFLADETAVNQGLAALGVHATTTLDAFSTALAQIERRGGFAAETIRLDAELDTQAFLDVLKSKRPILDIGVLAAHGALTHRMQWAMITNRFFGTWGSVVPAELYAYCGNQLTLSIQPDGLFGVVFDSPSYFRPGGLKDVQKWKPLYCSNGKSPEYLMGYMVAHDGANVRRMADFSRSLSGGGLA
jgi:hypothetical protein